MHNVLHPLDKLAMETKRCTYCHKLQRASARTCSRCGRPFAETKKVTKPAGRYFSLPSIPSVPSASPHRAGHYSGLHPEDQPYQTNMINVQRAHEQKWEDGWRQLPRQEPEVIILPLNGISSDLEVKGELDARSPFKLVGQKASKNRFKPPQLPRRLIPVLLTASCIFFILASSILTFVLLGKRASVMAATIKASPDTGLRIHDTFTLSGSGFGDHNLITFTYDINKMIVSASGDPLEAHSDTMGNFAIQISVPDYWNTGTHFIHVTDEAQKLSVSTKVTIQADSVIAPHLQLSTTTSTFSAAAPGVVSNQAVTLINGGGDRIAWQESSDSPWLTTTPSSGTFSGREDVQVIVNRGSLMAQAYTGHITFKGDSQSPVTLTVKMEVSPAPASLSVSTSALTYSATTEQKSLNQTITVQNTGNQALDWASRVTTGNGLPWLSITPGRGHLEPNTSITVTVSVQSNLLVVGSYQGAIVFTGGADAYVRVFCNVVITPSVTPSPAAVINVPTEPLVFTSIKGQNPNSQSVMVTNTGNMPLNWVANMTGSGATFVAVTPLQGNLAPGQAVELTVAPQVASATAGMLTSVITVKDNDAGSKVQSQQIPVTIVVRDQASINVSSNSLVFHNNSSTISTSQQFAISNKGSEPLHWSIEQDPQMSTSWLTITTSAQTLAGTINPGDTLTVNVNCNSLNLASGAYVATIVIKDSDSGTLVIPQDVDVTLNVG